MDLGIRPRLEHSHGPLGNSNDDSSDKSRMVGADSSQQQPCPRRLSRSFCFLTPGIVLLAALCKAVLFFLEFYEILHLQVDYLV